MEMIFALVVLALLLLGFAISWGPISFAYYRARKTVSSKWRKPIADVMQVMVVIALANLCISHLYYALSAVVLPLGLANIGFFVSKAIDLDLWSLFWPSALGAAACIFALCKMAPKPVQRLSVFLTLLGSVMCGMGVANHQTMARIVAQANDHGATCLATKPLWASVSIWANSPYGGRHARAYIDGEEYAWSYATQSFFESNVYGKVTDLKTGCHLRGFTPRKVPLS